MCLLINTGGSDGLAGTQELANPTHLAYHTSKFELPLWKSGSLPGCPVKLWCSLAASRTQRNTPFVSVEVAVVPGGDTHTQQARDTSSKHSPVFLVQHRIIKVGVQGDGDAAQRVVQLAVPAAAASATR